MIMHNVTQQPDIMIRLSDLRKTFATVQAVDGLNLDICRGEIFGLLGPNGAGKTTTVKLAVGLLKPDAGRVTIARGKDPRSHQVRRLIGVAPQALALYEELSAEQNLVFFARLQSLTGSALRQRVDWCLDFTGLKERKKDRVAVYSGGMKRRLNLAVALVHEPEVLFLDEPTAGVDPQSRNAIFQAIERLQESGRTIVYTTHYMEEAERLCNRVGIMDHGRLLDVGNVPELLERHGGCSLLTAQTNTGSLSARTGDPLGQLNKWQQDHALRSFTLQPPDLETVFLNLTGRSLRD